MKKLWLLPMLPLALAACGPKGTDPAPVDPLTLTLSAKGKVATAPQNFTVPATTPLFEYNKGQAYNIGTINPDKSLTISISPDQIKNFVSTPINEPAKMFVSTCTTNINVSGGAMGSLYRFITADFTVNGQHYSVTPHQSVKNADGTYSRTEQQFWYVSAPANYTGTVQCEGALRDFNLNLKAGWNRVTRSWTYNPANQQVSTYKYVVADYSNTYTGPWDVDAE